MFHNIRDFFESFYMDCCIVNSQCAIRTMSNEQGEPLFCATDVFNHLSLPLAMMEGAPSTNAPSSGKKDSCRSSGRIPISVSLGNDNWVCFEPDGISYEVAVRSSSSLANAQGAASRKAIRVKRCFIDIGAYLALFASYPRPATP